MKCLRCQTENPPQAKFCLECAAPLAPLCTSCGAQLPALAKFCPECGHPVDKIAAGPPRFATPDAYTPKHLAEKILTSKTLLEGERKQVTVLFADLKGSLELLADRDPEQARKILDPVVERMMEAVHRYEGTVNQVMGDGIMALFGAPLAHEDHAIRACYAALRMQAAIRRYASELRRSEGLDVQIRVGLNSGEVVVCSVGKDLHMDYAALGQTTHLAARMEQLARPGTTLVTADTLRLCEGYVSVNPLGPTPVKGLSEPIEVYELTGGGSARTRFQAGAARGLTLFVGRDAELEQLRQALERAGAGHGQVVAIVGEAGVGKSRLLHEFTHSHRVQGWTIIASGSVSYRKAMAYSPVIDLLKDYFKIQDRDDPREIRDKVIGRVLGLDRAIEPLLPPLLALLDVAVDDPAWDALDSPQRRQRTLDAVKRLLLRESLVQPLLLVIEDLHWIDNETQALLDGLVDSLGSMPVLFLVNYRPEYEHRWSRKTYYTRLRIESLPPEGTGELLQALLGDSPGLEPLKQMLRRRGNPFFLEETVRTLVETKALEGERGAYRLVRPVQTLQIPATVQAILAARIDRLPVEDKQLLQTAAVIGKDVPYAILAQTAELPEEALRRALGQLEEAEFLYETALFPDLEYSFKHALTHEVAYGSLLQDRRRILHGRIVEAIERCHPDRLAEHVDRLAHHAFRGEVWGKAVSYLRQAGAKAFSRSAHREAFACFEQALTALSHLPDTRETREQAIDVRFDLRHSLFPLAEYEGIERCLREAEALAAQLGDQRRLGWVSAYMCSHHLCIGSPAVDVSASAQRVEALGAALGDDALQIAALYYSALARYLCGDLDGSEQACRNLIQSLEGERTRDRFGLAVFPAVLSRAYLARTLAERGAFTEAEAHGRDAIRVAEALDHPFSLAFASFIGLAHVSNVRGEFDQSARVLERANAVCREWNISLYAPLVMASLGRAYAWSGRVGDGICLLEQALNTNVYYFHTLSVVQLGEAYLLAGRVEDARASADRALALARERGERGHEAWALHLLGEVTSHRDPQDAKAPEHYGEALALAEALGMRPLVAHCHLGFGKLCRHAGDMAKAEEHLSTAANLYREMGMHFWLTQVEA